MASHARGDEDKSLLIDAVDKQPTRLDMALAVPAVRPAQRVVVHCLRQTLPAHERLENAISSLERPLPRLLTRLQPFLSFDVNLSSIMA